MKIDLSVLAILSGALTMAVILPAVVSGPTEKAISISVDLPPAGSEFAVGQN